MFSLTSYERKFFIFVIAIILFGSILRFFNIQSKISKESIPKETTKTIINVNIANHEELKKIPYIGDKIASNIIEYRKNVGDFKTLDDLKKVKGIGDKKLELIKDYITF